MKTADDNLLQEKSTLLRFPTKSDAVLSWDSFQDTIIELVSQKEGVLCKGRKLCVHWLYRVNFLFSQIFHDNQRTCQKRVKTLLIKFQKKMLNC